MSFPTNTQRRSISPILVGIVVSTAALLLLYILIDLEAVTDTLRHASLVYVGMSAIAIYPLAIVARGYRWWLLLRQRFAFSRGLHINNVGYMANMIFPARLGEIVRLVLVRNEPAGDSGQAISAVAVERLLDILFALLCIALGLALLDKPNTLPSEVVTSLSVFLVVVVGGFAFLFFIPALHPNIIRFAQNLLHRTIPHLEARLTGLIERTLTSMQQLSNPRQLVVIVIWSAITWVLYAAFYHVVLLAFDTDAEIGASVLATGFIALSIGVPSVPSYAGPFHVGAALALSMYGFNEAVAASFALVAHALVTLLTIAVGIWSMQQLRLTLRILREYLPRFSGEQNQDQMPDSR